jgi:hypothetical protein
MLLSVAWGPLLVLLHELGHAFAALALTDGEVKIRMRPGYALVVWGECIYEPERVRTPRGEALIAAAGPAVSLVAAVALGWAALETTPLGYHRGEFGTRVLDAGAICAAGQLFLTALPLRYGAGLGPHGGESDGRAVWRILTGGLTREERRQGRPERAIGPVFATLLAIVFVLAALVDPVTGLLLAGIFGIAFLLQRSG